MSLNNWIETEQPREKLLRHGAQQLSDAELLAILFRTGVKGCNVVDLARQLLKQYGGLRGLLKASRQQLCQAKGIGDTKYAQLQAMQELSRRQLQQQLQHQPLCDNSVTTKRYIVSQLRHLAHEVFGCLFLDAQCRLIRFEILFRGTIDHTQVHAREVVKHGLSCNACAVILCHNHPSGRAEASKSDIKLTKNLRDSLQLVDITVIDHIIVGENDSYSFVDHGLLFN